MIGTVHEEAGTAHLVYRSKTEIDGVTVRKMAVASLKKSGDSWWMLLLGDSDAISQQLRRALQATRAEDEEAAPPTRARHLLPRKSPAGWTGGA